MRRKKEATSKKVLQAANRARFIRAYSECGTITEACRRARVSDMSHYRWLEDPVYKQEFETARQRACDRLVEEARRRAHEGAEEPIVYQGEIQYQLDANGERTDKPVTIRRYSDVLLMFLIKGMRPEVYRENYRLDVSASVSAEIRNPHLAKLTTEQLQLIHQWHQDGNGRVHSDVLES